MSKVIVEYRKITGPKYIRANDPFYTQTRQMKPVEKRCNIHVDCKDYASRNGSQVSRVYEWSK